MIHIYEKAPVPLQISYTIPADGTIEFQHVYALDNTGAPVGPDLCGLLHGMAVLVTPTECIQFLSLVAEDILCHPPALLLQ